MADSARPHGILGDRCNLGILFTTFEINTRCFNANIHKRRFMFQKIKINIIIMVLCLSGLTTCAFGSNQGPITCPEINCGVPNSPTSTMTPTWKNVTYASASSLSSEVLDLYTPTGVGPFPTIVYVHGGGFRIGDKSEAFNKGIVAAAIADGYAVASINYRLSGEATFPAAPQDVKAAIRWLRANASTYHLDPT